MMRALSTEDHSPAGAGTPRSAVIVVSEEGRIRRVVEPLLALGYIDPDGLPGRLVTDLAHPEDRGVVSTLLRAALGPDQPTPPAPATIRVRHRDGRWVRLSVSVRDGRSDPTIDGIALHLAGTNGHAAAAGTPLPGMASLADALSTGILAADQTGSVVYANGAAAELFWMPPAALLEQGWLAPIHIDDLEEVQAAAAAALAGLAHQDVTFQLWIDADHARWVHARFSGLRSSTGRNGWVAALEDITSRRAAEHALSFQATHDALTGLPDRLLLRDRLEQGVARLDRHDATLGVLFVDLDGFKAVNDEHGHAVGDLVLVELAGRIAGAVRPGDTAARVGGDEFVVVADDVDEANALAIAERVAGAIAGPVTFDDGEVTVGVSIGVTLAGPGESVDDILNRADQAMYRAKRNPDQHIELAVKR
jgi:diguanylate cyclase (GGDEF)-like protein/PAS domain S-box-containing protein